MPSSSLLTRLSRRVAFPFLKIVQKCQGTDVEHYCHKGNIQTFDLSSLRAGTAMLVLQQHCCMSANQKFRLIWKGRFDDVRMTNITKKWMLLYEDLTVVSTSRSRHANNAGSGIQTHNYTNQSNKSFWFRVVVEGCPIFRPLQ